MAEATGGQKFHTFVVVRESGKQDRIVVWDTEEISVGRASENDVCAEDQEVSQRHVVLKRSGGEHTVRDVGSSNGTFVNGERIESRVLQSRDVIRMATLQIAFFRAQRSPGSFGVQTDYASQLKDFPVAAAENPESTVLGLSNPLPGNAPPGNADGLEEDFEVEPAGDFGHDLQRLDEEREAAAAEPRDLDLEIDPPDEEIDAPRHVEAPATTGRLSLHVEIEGLTPDLRRLLEGIADKEVELPGLRLRVKRDDL